MFGIKQRLSKFAPLSGNVKHIIGSVAARKSLSALRHDKPYVVVVDGLLGYEPLSLYYFYLLFALQYELKRPIRVVLLLQKSIHRLWSCNRIFSQIYETNYVAFNTRKYDKSAKQSARLLASGLTDQKSILDIKVKGLHFGPNIYAGYLRKHFVGRMHPSSMAVDEFLVEACSNIELADAVIAQYKPDLLLLSHSDYHSFGAFFKKFLQAGIPSVIAPLYGEGRVGGRLYANLADFEDDARNYVFSCTERTWNEAVVGYSEADDALVSDYLKKRFAGDDNSFNGDYHKSTRRLQKDRLWQELGIKRTFTCSVLIAAHLLWDDATSSYRNLYVDYFEWLEKTLEAAKQNDKVLWIVKAHPSELHMGTRDRVADIVKTLFGSALPDHVVFLDADTPFNTYSIIEAVDAVVTVRGTIGYESACRGHSVINAGSGPYTGQGFNREFETSAGYEDFLLHLHEHDLSLSPEQVRLARIAIFVYLMNKGPVSPLLRNVDSLSALGTSEGLDPAADPVMQRFARTILQGRACDLL